MAKRLLVFGPPGVGKGTHARRLASQLGVPHIATGDMLREAISQGTETGRKVEADMKNGDLVSDDLVLCELEHRLAQDDAQNGFVLEGFPRTVRQAEALRQRVIRGDDGVDAVVALSAPERLLLDRILSRQTCSACGAAWNRISKPTRDPERCDECGGQLVSRHDDNEQAVRRRLAEYEAKTAPVIEYFRGLNWPVVAIASTGDMDAIFGRIAGAVGL